VADTVILEALFRKILLLEQAERRIPDLAEEIKMHRRRLEERLRREAEKILGEAKT